MLTRDLIARMPKAELHVHLDGSLRPETMIELARDAKVELPSTDPDALRRHMLVSDAKSLEDYLKRFDITVSLLQTAEAIERVSYEMVEDGAADNLRYLEVRYCPHLSVHHGLSMDEVVAAQHRGFARGERDFGLRTRIINCSLRHYPPDRSIEIAELSVRSKALGVVAFDLAGGEAGFPARGAWRRLRRGARRQPRHHGPRRRGVRARLGVRGDSPLPRHADRAWHPTA
jgi:adenosine deaminase